MIVGNEGVRERPVRQPIGARDRQKGLRRERESPRRRVPRAWWPAVWLLVVMGSLSWVLSRVISDGFLEAENEGAHETLRAARGVWEQNERSFGEKAADWGAWDDSYRFVQDGSREFVRSNLQPESLQILRLDALAIVARDGNIRFGTDFERSTGRALPLSSALRAQLKPNAPLLRFSSLTERHHTLISTRRGLMSVVSCPILTSQLKGPVRGAMVMARLLDSNEMGRLSQASQLTLSLSTSQTYNASTTASVQRLSDEQLLISMPLRDLAGRVVAQLNVSQPRVLWRQGQSTLRWFNAMFWMLGLSASLLFLLVEGRAHREQMRLSREKEDAQNQLIETGARYHRLMDSTPDAIVLADGTGRIRDWNSAAQTMFGYRLDEVFGQPLARLFATTSPDASQNSKHSKAAPQNQNNDDFGDGLSALGFAPMGDGRLETRGVRASGEVFPLEVSLATWQHGHERFLAGILRDGTERQRTAQRLENSLREKEILLKEIHHRVKNNMQVISSILNWQASQTADDKVRASLRDSQNRIKSMALIHEKLYQSDELSQVDIGDYLELLVKSVLRSQPLGARVRWTREGETVSLDIDRAAPCGLIVNELVSNALEHAFGFRQTSADENSSDATALPDTHVPSLQLRLQVLAAPLAAQISASTPSERANVKQLQVEIWDNGKGLAPEFDFRTTTTLGLQLVTTLTEQLGGQIAVRSVPWPQNEHGTRWTITFPLA